jgi:mono/diheme cytochrome c family protein
MMVWRVAQRFSPANAVAKRAMATAGCGLLIAAAAHDGIAQTETVQGSTLEGVYSAPQATRGEETYFGLCVGCHPVATHTGTAFVVRWDGRPVAELFDAIKEKMPKNDPGSLTTEETVQLVAYLLKLNAMPAGTTELEADAEALKKIRIETPGAAAKGDGR